MFDRLLPEHREFLLLFIKSGGDFEKLAAQFQVSFPTIRNRLYEIVDLIQQLEAESRSAEVPGDGTA